MGAISDERVMVFSGGGPGLLEVRAMMTRQSPEVTAFTLPLNHPVDPAVDDAISTASCIDRDLHPKITESIKPNTSLSPPQHANP